jgi:hypothetical protein
MLNKERILAIFLITLLLLVPISVIALTQAQSDATIIVLDATGGTTDPTGTTTYPDGTAVTITATPSDQTYVFNSWTVSSTAGDSYNTVENPLVITVAAGVTYAVQPAFDLVQPVPGGNLPTDMSSAAIVVILAGNGGTSSPAPGTYALADASQLMLTAMPASGWVFSHWVISGSPMNHGAYAFTATPTDNPYTVDHGYGYHYNYQPVFTPVGSATPTPSGPTPTPGGTSGGMSTDTWIIIALVIVIIVMAIGFGVYAAKKK